MGLRPRTIIWRCSGLRLNHFSMLQEFVNFDIPDTWVGRREEGICDDQDFS